jgi:hypothetical protein
MTVGAAVSGQYYKCDKYHIIEKTNRKILTGFILSDYYCSQWIISDLFTNSEEERGQGNGKWKNQVSTINRAGYSNFRIGRL